MLTEVAMAVSEEMAQIEASLSSAGLTVKALCATAGVNQSTWTRWKAGSNEPNMATWAKVRDAFTTIMAGQVPSQGVM
jgi:predicted transcriptional regulator